MYASPLNESEQTSNILLLRITYQFLLIMELKRPVLTLTGRVFNQQVFPRIPL